MQRGAWYISVLQDPGLQTDVCQGRQQSEPILQDNQLLEALIPTTYYLLIFVKPKSCHNQIPPCLKTLTLKSHGPPACSMRTPTNTNLVQEGPYPDVQ